MTRGPAGVTVVLHRDGALDSRRMYLPGWLLTLLAICGTGVVLLLLLGLLLYGPALKAAASVPGLRRDIARLEAENSKVRELALALDHAESRYNQLRQMLGADKVADYRTGNSGLPVSPTIKATNPDQASPYDSGASLPSHWPLDERGFITRGHTSRGAPGGAHEGIDIAVPLGSVVRAAGGGEVIDAGSDPEYGYFVLLQHPGGYQTRYGHLSRITVQPNRYVAAGEVVGLSGNSGRSSAPHLHFEVRQEGRAVDPLDFVTEGEP